jgi:4-deoxy-L-threo-5-hexosulose-uronate ketol-isomerase
MDIRQPIHSEHAHTLDTAGLRRHFLVEDLFRADQATLTYSQIERIIVGGAMPLVTVVGFTPVLAKQFAVGVLREGRELGVINAAAGTSSSTARRTRSGPRRALRRHGRATPASAARMRRAPPSSSQHAPAHRACPTRWSRRPRRHPPRSRCEDSEPAQYLQAARPGVVETCQLTMA